MAATDFIVAIEFGVFKDHRYCRKEASGRKYTSTGPRQRTSSDFIRKGVIYNLDKTAQSLTSIIKKLESTLKASIGKVYVASADNRSALSATRKYATWKKKLKYHKS